LTRLVDILAAPPRRAVYRIAPTTSTDDVEAVTGASGWGLVRTDTAGLDDKRAVLAAFKDAFGFADWFGHNLDALADSLGDVRHELGTVLLWDNPAAFAAADSAQFEKVLDVLRDRAINPAHGGFVTLLRDLS
jgi:RNAse (barnase) inhibitor barstar